MSVTDSTLWPDDLQGADARSEWVRLRTLILLRWAAIGGQVASILVAAFVYDVDLRLVHSFLIVGIAVLANIVSIAAFPASRRLSETEAMWTFVFDCAQLAALLALTGGLSNPFALLILAPVTIAATTLRAGPTVLIGGVTIGLITLVAIYHLPLRLGSGGEITVPGLFEFGFWAAIVIGVVFLGLYARRVSSEIHAMQDALLATQLALSREQKLTDLGGVVAAAAHELGSPLATIKLVSTELIDALSDRPELREDAELIRSQADRCRDILQAMGRSGKDDLHMRTAPIGAVIREAAEPHSRRDKALVYSVPATNAAGVRQPVIVRRPEVIHGLRNLIQNAVDFASTSVWIDADWTDSEIVFRVSDDGNGYPPDLIGRIGDPFVRGRRHVADDAARPGYEGMGLGLFIAKTLLERTGATLTFENGSDPFLRDEEKPTRSGAVVTARWPRARIEARISGPLGENPSIGA